MQALNRAAECPLCLNPGGRVVWRNAQLRVVDPADDDYPGLTRVIWETHAAEMTDLAPRDRDSVMQTVWTIESAQRVAIAPDKINVASLGNIVPHVHWHIIPRWRDDPCFPDSIWSQARAPRDGNVAWPARRDLCTARLPHYWQMLVDALNNATP